MRVSFCVHARDCRIHAAPCGELLLLLAGDEGEALIEVLIRTESVLISSVISPSVVAVMVRSSSMERMRMSTFLRVFRSGILILISGTGSSGSSVA